MDENNISVEAAKAIENWIKENRIVLGSEEGQMITFIPSFRGKYTYEPRHYVHLLLGIQEEGHPWQVGRVSDDFLNAIANDIQLTQQKEE